MINNPISKYKLLMTYVNKDKLPIEISITKRWLEPFLKIELDELNYKRSKVSYNINIQTIILYLDILLLFNIIIFIISIIIYVIIWILIIYFVIFVNCYFVAL